MCEAFSELGHPVELWHPRRHQSDPALANVDVFEFYSLSRSFKVRSLPNLDLMRARSFFPGRTFAVVSFIQVFIWAMIVSRVARGASAQIYYTRDPVVAAWLTSRRLPTVFEAHLLPARFGKAVIRRFARKESLIRAVGVTSFITDGLVELGVPATKAITASDAVDLKLFSSSPAKEVLRTELGLPSDRPIVGYIGRFETMGMEKGIKELLKAVATLHRYDPRPMVVCVGGPRELVLRYRRVAQDNGLGEEDALFKDRVPTTEIPSWIRACDVVTIPWPATRFSSFFTSPLKLFEYMASEVPIVASNLPSLREVLVDEQNALLVKPGDVRDLAGALERVLFQEELSRRLAAQAARDVAARTWIRRARQVLGSPE